MLAALRREQYVTRPSTTHYSGTIQLPRCAPAIRALSPAVVSLVNVLASASPTRSAVDGRRSVCRCFFTRPIHPIAETLTQAEAVSLLSPPREDCSARSFINFAQLTSPRYVDAWADGQRYNHRRYSYEILTARAATVQYAIHKIHTRSSPFMTTRRGACVDDRTTISPVQYRNALHIALRPTKVETQQFN